jgi:hypothetical protein
MLIVENPSISFIPNLPRHKKSKGGHVLTLCYRAPPRMKSGGSPFIEVKSLNAKPLLEVTPKSNGATTIDKVINRLQNPLAGTIPVI